MMIVAPVGAAQSTAPTLPYEMRQIVAKGSPGVITFVNDGHDVRLRAAGVADKRSGKVQAGVIVNVNPIPKAVSGEPLGATKTIAAVNALGRAHC